MRTLRQLLTSKSRQSSRAHVSTVLSTESDSARSAPRSKMTNLAHLYDDGLYQSMPIVFPEEFQRPLNQPGAV